MSEEERNAARLRMNQRRASLVAALKEANSIGQQERRQLSMEFEEAANEARRIVSRGRISHV